MGPIDYAAVVTVCLTVVLIYLLERRFLATMRTDAAMHAERALNAAGNALDHLGAAANQRLLAEQHAQRAFASAERAQTVADKDRAKIESRLASLEARAR